MSLFLAGKDVASSPTQLSVQGGPGSPTQGDAVSFLPLKIKHLDAYIEEGGAEAVLAILPEVYGILTDYLQEYPFRHHAVYDAVRPLLVDARRRNKLKGKHQQQPVVPTPKSVPVEKTLPDGSTLVDKYGWLENKEDPEVLQYLEAENKSSPTLLMQTGRLAHE